MINQYLIMFTFTVVVDFLEADRIESLHLLAGEMQFSQCVWLDFALADVNINGAQRSSLQSDFQTGFLINKSITW